jgi:hypothetical protein
MRPTHDVAQTGGFDWLRTAGREISGVHGELHAILLDNDWVSSDDIYIKHYSVSH